MDRNFEKVYSTIIRHRGGLPRLTREYLNYYGFHFQSDEDIPAPRRKLIIYESVWRRFNYDLFKSDHVKIASYLVSVELLFNVNLIPSLYLVLNSVLPEGYKTLNPKDVVTQELVEYLDAYLLWKSDVLPTEKPFTEGVEVIKYLLEAHLTVIIAEDAAIIPGREDYLHRWIDARRSDTNAIKPSFCFT